MYRHVSNSCLFLVARGNTRRKLREENKYFQYYWHDFAEKMKRLRTYEIPFLMDTIRQIEGISRSVVFYFYKNLRRRFRPL